MLLVFLIEGLADNTRDFTEDAARMLPVAWVILYMFIFFPFVLGASRRIWTWLIFLLPSIWSLWIVMGRGVTLDSIFGGLIFGIPVILSVIPSFLVLRILVVLPRRLHRKKVSGDKSYNP